MNIVILGAGQAAASLAAKLRALGHGGGIALIGDEPAAPYQRPPLSKAYLLGEMGLDRLTLRAPDWWDEQGIALHLGERAVRIDRARRVVATERGEYPYDQLALTLGASPRRLPAAMGGDLPGVHVVRNLADIAGLRPALVAGRRLVVIGGGYIGLEAAAVARKLGLEVALVEAAPRILGRVAAPETADMIRALHRAHGVEIVEGTGIARITGDTAADGVELADGRRLPADLVICGIGIAPETALAEAAGLAIDNGIAVDALGRSSDPSIWAAGDCASFPAAGGRLRLESVGNAIDMAEAVAANMLGADAPYVPKPWFWSDQFDAKLQIAGLNLGYDRVVTRPAANGGSVWYFRGGRLIAVDALNDARAYMIGKRLIEAGRSPEPEAVAEATELKALMA
ncbi:FAD-dependent oxidoreductase [Paracoccus sp. APAP_BH8]|uniref:NAD(P)/FAD-dependent oxidoreductase n=1 Tax=Paracoccus TaxID=265 RepID=UPI000466C062|nr:FAD-dependent oxidoreductase [Paracoccus pantotrophus]MDF3854638.1 FAD-dependent oxidoreductase [Paracoccus pantotrophus]RDE00805.1 pyridine nucleotide-disulfide oxidoreductase [Paracoccus pantotrophus]WGR63867.1 pyridine nucleotide-disulfide oxidoreductase [Paracoccus pantotrophus]SFO43838.1 3-phenylpropionate/trans-cinnamate dioxygenase ferredoxin reductase subunit [Paracoccus pantotrophus]